MKINQFIVLATGLLLTTPLLPAQDAPGSAVLPTPIKDIRSALTLSRFPKDGQVHILAVLKDSARVLTGVDLSQLLNRSEANPFALIKGINPDSLANAIQQSMQRTRVAYDQLLPAVTGSKHVALGINYDEHGKETGIDAPFLFPKLVATDAAIHHLQYNPDWLLDHEVELGVVFGEPVLSEQGLDQVPVGFLVINDYTDRATLLRKIDSDNLKSGKGFPEGKSKPGFMPTGPYVVIPRDWRAFVKEVELTLSVNGQTRQKERASAMVWDISRTIRETLATKGEKRWTFNDQPVGLIPAGSFPKETILMTGTPAGVVFNSPSGLFITGSVVKYIFTLRFFTMSMKKFILSSYLNNQRNEKKYLKPGDQVTTHVTYLGAIYTSVDQDTSAKPAQRIGKEVSNRQ